MEVERLGRIGRISHDRKTSPHLPCPQGSVRRLCTPRMLYVGQNPTVPQCEPLMAFNGTLVGRSGVVGKVP